MPIALPLYYFMAKMSDYSYINEIYQCTRQAMLYFASRRIIYEPFVKKPKRIRFHHLQVFQCCSLFMFTCSIISIARFLSLMEKLFFFSTVWSVCINYYYDMTWDEKAKDDMKEKNPIENVVRNKKRKD